MGNSSYCGVILAAGKGTRMAPFSARHPKPMLPVGNKPILQRQIEYLRRLGITDIVIVVGHRGFDVSRRLGSGEQFGVSIRYFEQQEALGIAHAAGQLEAELSGPFVLILGDVFFIQNEAAPSPIEVFESTGAAAVLVTMENPPPELVSRCYSVTMADDGHVTRVVEKPRYAVSNLIGTGIYVFDLTVFDAIRRTPRTAMRDEYELTESIQRLIDDGQPIVTCPGVSWMENVTYPQDIIRCTLELLDRKGRQSILGANTRVHPDARVVRSAIGDDAVVEHPIEISCSVLFPGARLSIEKDLKYSIVTQHNILSLGHCFSPDRDLHP